MPTYYAGGYGFCHESPPDEAAEVAAKNRAVSTAEVEAFKTQRSKR